MAGRDARIGGVKEIYVQPGETHLVTQPAMLRTVLGSCVGVAFLVPRLGVAALSHPMMPKCPPAQRSELNVKAGRRYVDFAIRDVARQLDGMGVKRGEVVVKLFGGNDVLAVSADDPRQTIGRQNSEAALRVLAEEGFAVSASSLGGPVGVHIIFDTASGEVLLRRLDTGVRPRGRRSGGIARHLEQSR